MKILIAGDLFISDDYKGNKLIDKSVIELFRNSDYGIVNLESPITKGDHKRKIEKTGPHLRTSGKAIVPYLKKLNIGLVTLANNHILDYGEYGLNETLEILKSEKFDYVGVGGDSKNAAQPHMLVKHDIKISILNFAENEWASATECSSGANSMDLIENTNQIRRAKEKSDFVFVIVHGGHEYYNFPSPRMQKQYRFYAEQGADIVIGHHTHCISGSEIHNGVPIYYSLGNFLFTKKSAHKDWYEGLILEIEIKNGELFTNLHPIKQHQETFELKLLKEDKKESILNKILTYDNIISDEIKLKNKWDDFIKSREHDYLRSLSSFSLLKKKNYKGFFL